MKGRRKMKNKKGLIGLCVAGGIVVIALIIALAVNMGSKGNQNGDLGTPDNAIAEDTVKNGENGTQTDDSAEEEKIYTPTFMYFISAKDDNYEETNKVIEKLKKEYDGKIVFDIKNVDEDPSLLENFPVKDNTPALIMLNKKNDISNFLFKNGNYDDLKAAIDAALE